MITDKLLKRKREDFAMNWQELPLARWQFQRDESKRERVTKTSQASREGGSVKAKLTPIGRSGQYLALTKPGRVYGISAGQTGAGRSTSSLLGKFRKRS